MNEYANRIISFVIDNFPSWRVMAIGGIPAFLWSYLCLFFAGVMKRNKGLKTGYSRKIFHFCIFTTVSVLHAICGTPAVCLFGGMATLVIFYAIFRGSGHLLYEAIARESDSPWRTYYIIIPYFATLLGGIATNILVNQVSIIGYLVTGLGDAIGEPVGTRFGKHTYHVPSFGTVKSIRSYEGSLSVFVVCMLSIMLGIFLCPILKFDSQSFIMIPLLGFICTAVEAITPHGWDNATMQIIPSLLAKLILV